MRASRLSTLLRSAASMPRGVSPVLTGLVTGIAAGAALFFLVPVHAWASPAAGKSTGDGSRQEVLGRIILTDGGVLENARLIRTEPDGLRISHRAGVGKIRMEVLPAELVRRFGLDPVTATAWRQERKKRQDAADAARLRAQVQELTTTARSEQEAKARGQRIAIFDQARQGANYAALDEELLGLIRFWQEAGRADLADRFRGDRTLLREQEIARPSVELEADREALARRVRELEAGRAALGGRTPGEAGGDGQAVDHVVPPPDPELNPAAGYPDGSLLPAPVSSSGTTVTVRSGFYPYYSPGAPAYLSPYADYYPVLPVRRPPVIGHPSSRDCPPLHPGLRPPGTVPRPAPVPPNPLIRPSVPLKYPVSPPVPRSPWQKR